MMATLKVTDRFTAAQIDTLKSRLCTIAGEDVDCHVVVDNSIIGGFVITMDGKIYDTAVSTKLKKIKKYLKVAEHDE